MRVTVALTSTAERASRLAPIVTRHGLQPVPLPCIEVAPAPAQVLEEARELAGRADWILLTSPRSVSVIWPRGDMPAVDVAVVGPSTAEAVMQAGGKVEVVGEAGARDLVERLTERVDERHVFFPHAAAADPSTRTALERAGARVTALAVYETLPVAPGPDPVDGAVFASPSAISGWCMSRTLGDLTLAVMGETTRAALGERGYKADVVPTTPDFELLIALLADHLRQRSPA